MKRIFPDYAYGPGPRDGCWWDQTCDLPELPTVTGDLTCDVAIVGAGFTGLSAALALAEAGVDVVVLDAEYPGWGASGRNGGFCCLGGGMLEDAALDRIVGRDERLRWRQAECSAVAFVADLITRFGWDVDKHSDGETILAHRPRDATHFPEWAERIEENYGVKAQMLDGDDLTAHGMAGPFHGALTTPIGFGLNPRKYLSGLLSAALSAGARVFTRAPADYADGLLRVGSAKVTSENILFATNGYSSEDQPDWLAGRYMPCPSTALVTRPLSPEERSRAGWTTDQMCYDTRHLLHYFRLMPDGRFLFGMRGGLRASVAAETKARARLRAHFHRMFPAWQNVEVESCWSGFVCLARDRMPFVGQVPGDPKVWVSMCYHGNGVAMGSYCGALAADQIVGQKRSDLPKAMTRPMSSFHLGVARRAVMWSLYGGLALADV